MTIISRAATDDYRAGWDQIFRRTAAAGHAEPIDDPEPLIRNEDWLPIEKTNFDFSVWRLWSPLVIREHYEPIGDEL